MKPQLQILSICIAVVAIIIAYGTIRCRGAFVDPLTWSPVREPWDNFLDGWGITHLLFYALLGYLYPGHLLFSMALGVAWELVEMAFKERPFYLTECKHTGGREGWWVGRWQDLVMNFLGLCLGASLAGVMCSRGEACKMRWRM